MDPLPGLGDIGLGAGLSAGLGAGVSAAATGGISTLAMAAPALGSVVSGIFGMAGANAQNQNAEAAQQQTEAYDTYMADTQYQRGMADMKAAGLNPMLAYMQGGDSAPTAPMYQPSSPLSAMSGAVSNLGDDIGELPKRYAQIREANASANSAETAADQASQIEAPTVQAAWNNSAKTANDAVTAANNARTTGVTADVAQAGEGAATFYSRYNPYLDMASKAGNTVSSVLDAANIWKGLKYLGQIKKFNPDTHGLFDKSTGEVLP